MIGCRQAFQMNQNLLTAVACLLLLIGASNRSIADEAVSSAAERAQQCLECHDFGPESPVHPLLGGSHGIAGDSQEMAGRRGCEDCHGVSTEHSRAPTNIAPTVSFGPRWTTTSAAQDEQCLACHEENIAADWQNSLHMLDNLTCVTCHDIHSAQDKVLMAKQQAQVCTVCHKVQKKGIHGMAKRAARNPPCTECHNPHDHESAQAKMLQNHSAGCSNCHDLVQLEDQALVSDKAKSYHKGIARPGRTCIDCHEGIAHAPAEAGPATLPPPVQQMPVTLFYPGIADSDWLLQVHPGSQPLRQGANCQQCHRGEETAMGLSRAGDFQPGSREVLVAFARENEQLVITLQWDGPKDEASLALMWGDGSNEAFRRGGCFAACHSDLPGMSRDRGQQTGKYLQVSRSQQQRMGQPSITKDQRELDQLMAEGEFVELWQIQLESTTLERALLLDDLHLQPASVIQASRTYKDGQWTLVLRSNMHNTAAGISFRPNNKYTFGIALNSPGNAGGRHWVSLPMTFSVHGDDTNFKAQ